MEGSLTLPSHCQLQHRILIESGINPGQLLPTSRDPQANVALPQDPLSRTQFQGHSTPREQQALRSAAASWLHAQPARRVDDIAIQRQVQRIRGTPLLPGALLRFDNNAFVSAALRASSNRLSDERTHLHSVLDHEQSIHQPLTSTNIDEEVRRSLLLGALATQSSASVGFRSMLQHELTDLALVREYARRSQPQRIRSPIIDPQILASMYLHPSSLSNAVAMNPGLAALFTTSASSIHGGMTGELQHSSDSLGVARLPAVLAMRRDVGLGSSQHAMVPISESFPVKLHRLLLTLERNGGRTDIISFLPSGDAFAIHKPAQFENDMMRNHFPRMTRIASFMRQLNLYDFKRMADASTNGTYYHQNFKRDFPFLCHDMKRTKIKGSVKNETS